jgi:glutamyl-tRNA synthetase
VTVTRFAPSPTGRIHAGNVRTALVNWLAAKAAGGRFVLRIDDTDVARSEERYVEAIGADLDWLGLAPDVTVRQSERFALYEAALDRLAAQGRAYRAYETAPELDMKRKVQASQGKPPVYDRAALALTDADHARFAAEGVAPHWRFRLDPDPIVWDDAVRGACRVDPASLSDPVVRRADGTWLYMLPSVVDDIDLSVTLIARGEDHVTNSGVQLQMFAALGATSPRLAHLALLTGADAALSKRLGSEGVDQWRDQGVEPQAVLALLARLGTSEPVIAVATVGDLVPGFDLAHFGRATARFDPHELVLLNARAIHLLPHDAVAHRLPAAMTPAAWEAVRGNLNTVAEAADWWAVIAGPVEPRGGPDDGDYLAQARAALGAMPWAGDVWHAWTGALKASSGRKGRALFAPLRLALTGRDHGPEMAALLPLIGRDAALDRLARAGEAPARDLSSPSAASE